jgi:hypothetical protein
MAGRNAMKHSVVIFSIILLAAGCVHRIHPNIRDIFTEDDPNLTVYFHPMSGEYKHVLLQVEMGSFRSDTIRVRSNDDFCTFAFRAGGETLTVTVSSTKGTVLAKETYEIDKDISVKRYMYIKCSKRKETHSPDDSPYALEMEANEEGFFFL